MIPNQSAERGKLEACLDRDVRPALRGHAGDVRIVSVSGDGDVGVEFLGACRACPLKPVTFYTAVRVRLLQLDSVRSVHCESVHLSPHAMRRLGALMAPSEDEPH